MVVCQFLFGIQTFKGEVRSFIEEIQTENINTCNINEVITETLLHQWTNKLLWEKNKVLVDRKVAGSATY